MGGGIRSAELHAARLRPRRVQRHPPVRQDLAVLRRAGSRAARPALGGTRRTAWATRSTTGRRSLSSATSKRPRHGSVPTPTRTGDLRAAGSRLARAAARHPRAVPRAAVAATSRAPGALRLACLQSTTRLARRFRDDRARALVAGAGAHSILSLTEPISGAAALVMLSSRPRRRLAVPGRRHGPARRGARRRARRERRTDRDRSARRADGRPPAAPRCALRRGAAVARDDRR